MEAIPSQANLHLMSYSFRRQRVVLLLQVLLVAWFAGPTAAVEADQTLKLKYGWNAVWLEVEPTDASGGSLTCDHKPHTRHPLTSQNSRRAGAQRSRER